MERHCQSRTIESELNVTAKHPIQISAMIASEQFAYLGHHVEIVPPDKEHLVGIFWQIKIDGVLERNVLYDSVPVAIESAHKLIGEKIQRRFNNKSLIGHSAFHSPIGGPTDSYRLDSYRTP